MQVAITQTDSSLRSCIPALNAMSRQPLSSQPFSVLWRTALVRLPRAVPLGVLRYTSPKGPHPFVFSCPSRAKHLIPLYVFVSPKIQPEDAASIPVIIDFHGGGFFLGSCLEQAPFCSKMAKELNCVVVSVDYRMGPIDKFPAASEDAEDVLNAILDESAPGYQELRVAIAAKVADNIRQLQKSASKESISKRDPSKESLDDSSPVSSMTASLDSLKQHSKPNSASASHENLAIPTITTTTSTRPSTSRTASRTNLKPIRTNSSYNGQAKEAGAKKKSSREKLTRVLSRDSLKRAVSRDNFRRRKHRKGASSPLSPAAGTSTPDEVYVDLDKTRLAISGFSSGGNLALGMGMSFSPPDVESAWPCRFPQDYPHKIPLLLYYPSVDSRQLPSERTRPPGMPTGSKFWAEVNDLLMPTYLPRDQSAHPRASPGLVDVSKSLHPQARMLLVLPEYDNLAEQCEIWARRVEAEGRGKDLRVERFPGMKHGWTQMPESWLSDEERKSRAWIFDETIAFVASLWEGTDLDSLQNIVENETDPE